VIGAITTWRTDEPCPTCGAGLFLLETDETRFRWECRMCGDAPDRPADWNGGDW
jgi:ribosomal protein S27AE